MNDIDPRQEPVSPEEPEFYEEAPRSSIAEGIGIFVAMLALCVIGFAGYVWLTPGVEFSQYFSRSSWDGDKAASVATADPHAGHDMGSMGDEERCPVCNMFALRSLSAIMANWSDGSLTHHDSWDCVANWSADNKIVLQDAQVVAYTEAEGEQDWLAADTAFYRYDTEVSIQGSMPPNIAAFRNFLLAQAADDLGGEVLDFPALQEKLGLQTAGAAMQDSPEMDPMLTDNEHSGHTMEPAGTESGDTSEDMSQTVTGNLLKQAALADSSCPVCGMFADRSWTQVVVRWSDGSYSHLDCFDCAFGMQAEGSASISAIEVSLYDPDKPGSSFIDARKAFFLYDTKRIKGSMPPFVAAFRTEQEALTAQAELDGELMNFTELAARWQQ